MAGPTQGRGMREKTDVDYELELRVLGGREMRGMTRVELQIEAKKGDKIQFDEYQCQKCGRMTFIHHGDQSDLDFDGFRCTFCKCLTKPTREYAFVLEKRKMVR